MSAPSPGWEPGSATGIGSLPWLDPGEACRVALDEAPELPWLPELPARGPGADLIGRTAALLAGLHVDLQPSGWRLVPRPGTDERRARDLLSRDLDALEEQAGGYAGVLKLAAAGPWTLASTLELTRGDRALRDPGAVHDLLDSLAEGLAAHLADVARRVPGARLALQLDEPGLPGALAGSVPTASGFGRLPAVEETAATGALRGLIEALQPAAPAGVGVHCCSPALPLDLLRRAGAAFVAADLTGPGRGWESGRGEQAVGEAVEAGVHLVLGLVPSTAAQGPIPSDPRITVEPVRQLWHRLGLPAEALARRVVVSTGCGLAGASPEHALAALRACREAARMLASDPL